MLSLEEGASDGSPLTGVRVTLHTTQAIVSNIGITIQLNAYPPVEQGMNPNNIRWEQFVFAIGKDDAEQLLGTCYIFNQVRGGSMWNNQVQLPDVPPPPKGAGPTLPKDYQLIVELVTDPASKAITQATYTVVDSEGKSTTDSIEVPLSARAPIMAFQVDIIGHAGGKTSVFSSGAGTITYAAATKLTILSAMPSYAQGPNTAEKANSVYGELPEGPPASSIVQSFWTKAPEGAD